MSKYIIMKHLFLTFIFVAFTIINSTPHNFPLNVKGLHAKQKENPLVDPYLHTDLFFNAVHSGKMSFFHLEKKDSIDDSSKLSYENLSTQSIHETNTTTTLFGNIHYRSLDDEKISQNIIIGFNSIIDCNYDADIRIGDYYIGTANSDNPGVLQFSNYNSKIGFVFSRRVIEKIPITHDSNRCIKVETELVHPLQIVDTHIQSIVQFPYDRVIIPESDARNLKGDPLTTIDPPMLLCTNSRFTKNTGFIHKSGENYIKKGGIPMYYQYSLDTNGNECLYADATAPGTINFNHASGKDAIKKTIVLASGVICNNCYSFIGAMLIVDINIFGGKSSSFTFQAKDAGGAGFNLGININNPSFSASKYINLAGRGPVSSIPIAYDLSLNINFGGAWATIKGSGSAKGSATFSSGYTLYQEDNIMYSKSRWTSKHTLTNSNQLKPVYSESGFKLSNIRFTTIVAVSARIEYGLGGSIPIVDIGASIDFSSVLTATIQYFKGGSANDFSMRFIDEESSRRLTERNTKIYYPGDKIKFRIKYENFNPAEKTELYLTHHHPDEIPSHKSSVSYGTGTPIMKYTFKTSSSGAGEQIIEWTVPHDTNLIQPRENGEGHYFSIHSSAHLKRQYSGKYHLSQKRDRKVSDIIQYPTEGSSVSTHTPIEIKWDKKGMSFFRHLSGTDGMGSVKTSSNVSIFIIVYDKRGYGNAYKLATNILNNGSYKTILPSKLRNIGEKFTIGIHDSREYTKIGWHHGKFHLAPKRQRYEDNNGTNLEPVLFPSPILDTGLPLWSNSTILYQQKRMIQPDRKLIGPNTCPRASLSLLLQIEFGFDGFTVLGNKIDLGSVCSNPFTIIPQTNICI